MAKKGKTKVYICSSCGYEDTKWFAKCPVCGEWDTAKEFIIDKTSPYSGEASSLSSELLLSSFKDDIVLNRIQTGFKDLDKALNSGFAKGGVYLIAGEPGVGKSTLLSHIAINVSKKGKRVLYISGEESIEQVNYRLKRLLNKKEESIENLKFTFEISVEEILSILEKEKYDVLIVDSVQSIKTNAFSAFVGGSVQVRESTRKLIEYCKRKKILLLLIGHITKVGEIAGPKVLEHMVDGVIYFGMEKTTGLRLLRITKNRYGASDQIVTFEMTDLGLKEVEDITKYFLKEYHTVAGNALTVILEGNRLIPIEIQALVTNQMYSISKRLVSGVPIDRVYMIVAVISNRLKLKLEKKDIFISTSGGFRINDPASDMAIAASILSSYYDISLKYPTVFIGEIGLDGYIRKSVQMTKRISFAKEIGIEKIITSNEIKRISDLSKYILKSD